VSAGNYPHVNGIFVSILHSGVEGVSRASRVSRVNVKLARTPWFAPRRSLQCEYSSRRGCSGASALNVLVC
jgi:hypothetical protein